MTNTTLVKDQINSFVKELVPRTKVIDHLLICELLAPAFLADIGNDFDKKEVINFVFSKQVSFHPDYEKETIKQAALHYCCYRLERKESQTFSSWVSVVRREINIPIFGLFEILQYITFGRLLYCNAEGFHDWYLQHPLILKGKVNQILELADDD